MLQATALNHLYLVHKCLISSKCHNSTKYPL